MVTPCFLHMGIGVTLPKHGVGRITLRAAAEMLGDERGQETRRQGCQKTVQANDTRLKGPPAAAAEKQH